MTLAELFQIIPRTHICKFYFTNSMIKTVPMDARLKEFTEYEVLSLSIATFTPTFIIAVNGPFYGKFDKETHRL